MSRIRIGLIGCGGIARHHLGVLTKMPDVEIAALCDPEFVQIERCNEAFPTLRDVGWFADYRQMLDAAALDAVHINSLHTQHAQQIVDSFGKGLHVLCEKPMVTTVADAHRTIEARDKAGKVGLLSYQRHTQAEFRYIKRKIDSGEFGKPIYIAALQGQEWKRATAGSWRQTMEHSGGGQLNDSGSHILDIILWTTGLRAESVSAYGDNCGTPVDINSSVSVRFEGGAMASIAIVGDAPAWHEDITIFCERGAFFVRAGKLIVQDADGARFEAENLKGGSNPDANFIRAIQWVEEVQSPFEGGLRVIELTEAAWRSMEKGGEAVKV
jgi:predicted dehydrogenase